MDQYYIVTESLNQQFFFGKDLIDANSNKFTLVEYQSKKIDSKLTNNIIKHLASISDLSLDKFNCNYYYNKYVNVTRMKKKNSLWENWIRNGYKESKNPIDRRTITSLHDINLILSMMTIFLNAIKHNYNRIMIINATNKAIQFGDISKISQDFNDLIFSKHLCIISHMQTNYVYIIHQSIFNLILSEMSYFINKFDDILTIYINTYENDYQIFNHSNNCIPTNKINLRIQKPTLTINCDLILNSIRKIKTKYFNSEYYRFLSNHNNMTPKQVQLLNHIICKLPYDRLRLNYNFLNCLSFHHYLTLCMEINDHNYFQSINIQPMSPKLPNLHTIYFDHEFYTQLYPCYGEIFKNQNESLTHYLNHGKTEKLIGNQILFDLIKINQEYLLEQYLIQLQTLVQANRSMILYDHSFFNYSDQQKPIIYIITRTCNREFLFGQCCQSINKQYDINVRHLVSYDNEMSYNYIKKYEHIHKVIDLTNDKSKIHPNKYIDKIYDHIDQSEPGWVLILDDDDKFMTDYALCHMEQYLNNPDNLIIWMLYRPDKLIHPIDKNNPMVGEIASCCYIYHTSKIQKGIWAGNSIGDFTFFKYLFDNTKNHIYIDYPLTGVNYTDQVSGWTAM